MNWFALRQHRKQFFVFGLVLAAFAAFAVPTGLHYWHAYQHALTTCSLTNSCDNLADQLFGSGSGQLAKNITFAAGLFVPLLLGLFLGSPLFAKEYDEGTNKLVWTQSISRRKWLTVKLAWALGFALLYGLAFTALTSWWFRTTNAVYQDRFDPGMFDVQGLMPMATSLFFTTVGFVIGAWFRKVVLAMAVTIGVFVVAQMIFPNLIRPHYMHPVTITSPLGPNKTEAGVSTGANWVLARDVVDGDGKVRSAFGPASWPTQCQKLIQDGQDKGIAIKADGPDAIDGCLNAAGYHQITKYQPSYRYWDFERIEAGIYLGMAAVAVGATYWLVLRRDA